MNEKLGEGNRETQNEYKLTISATNCLSQDRHADDHKTPQIDSQQNYELISLRESGGKTTMKFKRKFETCDPEDNAVQVNGFFVCIALANRFSLLTDVSFLPQVCKIECGARDRPSGGLFPHGQPLAFRLFQIPCG